MALGQPIPKPVPPPPPRAYTPAESPAFFDNFLAQQTAPIVTPPQMRPQPSSSSEMTPLKKQVHANIVPSHLIPQTPDTSSRKRKAGQALESPSLKRTVLLSNGSPLKQESSAVTNGHSPAMGITPSIAITPSTAVAETSSPTPTPRPRLQPYVELPPLRREFQTPSQKGKERMRDEDQYTAFTSEDDGSPRKQLANGATFSMRRGDRNERGP